MAAGGRLLARFKLAGRDPDRRGSPRLPRRIEHTIGLLVERFDCRRIRVKDLWHLGHRPVRKILSHTVAVGLNARGGHPPLRFDRRVA